MPNETLSLTLGFLKITSVNRNLAAMALVSLKLMPCIYSDILSMIKCKNKCQ